VLRQLGRYLEAESSLRRGRSVAEAQLGEGIELALVRVLRVFRRAYGAVHYEVAVNLNNLGAARHQAPARYSQSGSRGPVLVPVLVVT
jgi:hypothetical protein